MRMHLLAFGMLIVLAATAQVPAVLSGEAFVRMVLENHPMARQAVLRPGKVRSPYVGGGDRFAG